MHFAERVTLPILGLALLAGGLSPRATVAPAMTCLDGEARLVEARLARDAGHLFRGLARAEAADRACTSERTRAAVSALRDELEGPASAAEDLERLRDATRARLLGELELARERLQGAAGPRAVAERGRAEPHAAAATRAFEQAVARSERATGRGAWQIASRASTFHGDLALSPDGTLVADAATDDAIRVWDVATGAPIRTLAPHRSEALAISPDDRWLVNAHDGRLEVSSIAGDAPDLDLELGRPIAFAADGHLFATSKTGVVELALPSGATIAGYPMTPPEELAVSGDELVTAHDRIVTRWRRGTGAKLGELTAATPLHTLAVVGGRIAVGTRDRISVYTAGAPVDVPLVDWRAVAIAGDALVAVDYHGAATVRDLAGRPRRSIPDLDTVGEYPSIALDERGTLLAASGAKGIAVWDLAHGRRVASFGARTVPARSLAFDATGERLAVGSESGHVAVWTMATGDVASLMPREGAPVIGLAFAPTGELATASRDSQRARPDSTIAEWRRDGTLAWSTDIEGAQSLAYRPGSHELGTSAAILRGTDVVEGIAVWDRGRMRFSEGDAIYDFAWTPDGTRLVRAGRSAIAIEGGPELDASVTALALAPRGDQLAAIQQGQISVWDLETGAPRRVMFEERGTSAGIAWSAAGVIAVGSHSGAALWDPRTGSRLAALDTHAAVTSLAFRPDGRVLALGCADGTVELRSVATGTLIAMLVPTADRRGTVATPDGAIDGALPEAGELVWQVGGLALPARGAWDRERVAGLLGARLAELPASSVPRAGLAGAASPPEPAACFPAQRSMTQTKLSDDAATLSMCFDGQEYRNGEHVQLPSACFDLELATGVYHPRAPTLAEVLGLRDVPAPPRGKLAMSADRPPVISDRRSGKLVHRFEPSEAQQFELVDETVLATTTPCAGPCSATDMYDARTGHFIGHVDVNTSYLSLTHVAGNVYAFNDFDSLRIALQDIRTGRVVRRIDAPAIVCQHRDADPDGHTYCSSSFGMMRIPAGLALLSHEEQGDVALIDLHGKLLAHHRVPICPAP